jgi:hypothetical protein
MDDDKGSANHRRKIKNEVFTLDEMIIFLHEALTYLPPGGYELTRLDRLDVEDAFVSWITKRRGFLNGVKLKEFIAWLEPIYESIDEMHNRELIFEGSPEHHRMEEELEEARKRQALRERSLRRLQRKSEMRAAASSTTESLNSLTVPYNSSFSAVAHSSWR